MAWQAWNGDSKNRYALWFKSNARSKPQDANDFTHFSCWQGHSKVVTHPKSNYEIVGARNNVDEMPDVVIHSTFESCLIGIRAEGGLKPGGNKRGMRPVMCAVDKRYIDPGAAGRRESATVDLYLDPAVLKQFARAGHSVQITQQNCLELRCFVPWFTIKRIVTVDDRKLYTRSDNLRTYKYRSPDGTKPQCGSPIPVSRADDEVPQMFECEYCGFYNVLGAQCCFHFGCRMAQSAEAIEEEMNHYKVEDKALYKRTKYGIGIVKFNVFGTAASATASG
jgi:hypothetical protein